MEFVILSVPMESEISGVIHMFIKALKLTHLEDWSPELKGIAPLDLGILSHVARDPDIILGDIKAAMDGPHSTRSSAIDRLERRGAVNRVICERDRRSFGHVLTEKGEAIQREHRRLDTMLSGLVFEALETDAERRTFIDLVEKVSRRIVAT